jgi:hypothetical protein
MSEWEDRLAAALGEDPLSPQELGMVLKLARDVAHGVERKLAPVASYLVGVHAGRLAAAGGARADGLRAADGTAREILPAPESAADVDE